MGFLNWLMKGVDIEEKEQTIVFDEEPSQNMNVNTDLKPNLDNLKNLSNMEKSSSVNVDAIIPTNFNQPMGYINATPSPQKSKIVVFKILNLKDLQSAIRHLATRQPCVLNMENLKKREIKKIMDFLNGAIFALNATVHRMQGKLYLASPEGIEIALQDKKKDKKRN